MTCWATALLALALLVPVPSLAAQSAGRDSLRVRPAPQQQAPGGVYHRSAFEIGELPLRNWLGPRAWGPLIRKISEGLLPNDGGAILMGLVVLLVVAGRFAPFRATWNLELLALLLVAVFMAGSIDRWAELERTGFADTPLRATQTFALTAIYLLTLWWAVRAAVGAFRSRGHDWVPNLGRPVLIALACALVLMNVGTGLLRPPDDAGIYTNLGGQRLLETGTLPYGDEKLRGGATAIYGPVLFLVHIPLQLASGQAAPNGPDADPRVREGYRMPPAWVTKVASLGFHLLALVGIFFVGRRLAGTDVGLALVCLYAGSPYVFGVGGVRYWAGGLPYISHMAPAGLVLLAFALLERPVLAGVALALATATVYFPAFMFPFWFAYYVSRRRGDAVRFTLGFGGMGLLVAALVVALTDTGPGENALGLMVSSSVEHVEGADKYGSSPYGFFGAHPAVARVLGRPLTPGSSLFKPMFLLVSAYSLAGFALGRKRRPAQLALLSASMAAAVQLWKTNAGGTFVAWYYALLLIGLFAFRPAAPALLQAAASAQSRRPVPPGAPPVA